MMNTITKVNLVYVIQLALIFAVGVICWQVLPAVPQTQNPTAIDPHREDETGLTYAPCTTVDRVDFYDKDGLCYSLTGDGNVSGDNGPYYKIVHYREGCQVRVEGSECGTTGLGTDLNAYHIKLKEIK